MPDHERSLFACGAPPLDRYIREQATQDIHRQVSKCFVACGTGEKTIAGSIPTASAKSSGPETTFDEDLFDAERIEAGMLGQADEPWAWCVKTGSRARTVAVKIKWADFQQSTRSRSLVSPVDSRAKLHEISLGLIRSVLPAPKGVRLVGVRMSNFVVGRAHIQAEASLLPESNMALSLKHFRSTNTRQFLQGKRFELIV